MKNQMKGKKGITLIALIVTIIVLLILAGVTIATLTGDNGLLKKATNAKETSTNGEIEEEIKLAWNKVYSDAYLNNYTPAQKANALKEELEKNKPEETVTFDEERVTVEYRGKKIVITDTGEMRIRGEMKTITAGQKAPVYENAKYISGDYTAIIPAGFTVSNEPEERSIETGLVIKDDAGNEFVWIPVEIPWKNDKSKKIKLLRYEFDTNGSPGNYSGGYIEEDSTNLTELKNYGNTIAKNIKQFISLTNSAGGFYIGRYEARKNSSGKLTENVTDDVWGDITQPNAAIQSRAMYSNSCFESDLINSYAWDTATLFLQEYDNRSFKRLVYSREYGAYRVNGSIAVKGATADKICNVYEMSTNYCEMTTETSNDSNNPCVFRGGWKWNTTDDGYVSFRGSVREDFQQYNASFRPILYIK